MFEALGSLFGFDSYPLPSAFSNQQHNALQQQYLMPIGQQLSQQQFFPCRHLNCPICKENAERMRKLSQELELAQKIKKEDYEKRCQEYVAKFNRYLMTRKDSQ